MLLYCSKTNNNKPRPQLLTGGSISLLDGHGRDKKKKKPRAATKEDPKTLEQTENRSPAQPPRVPNSPSRDAAPSSNSRTFPKPQHDKPAPKRRHVRFDSVELQEYAVTVGDHPFCKGYFPLTLDWCHARPVAFRINDYEAQKMRRSSHELWELHMNARERWERLRLVTGMNESNLANLEQTRHQRQ